MTKLTKRSQEKVQSEIDVLSQKKRRDMKSRERVRLLQLKLYQKAKQEKGYRFYILYDKLFQDYILIEAYKRAKRKNGSPGVDKQTFADIEKKGLQKFLFTLKEELRTRTYKPQAVKRVWIEKENGGQRPLGIPTIKDRVAQAACKMVIEPIFEADFEDSSYGFRPKRSAKDAIKNIKQTLKKGKTEVYDADLSQYFDTIPHEKLISVLKERITDPRILYLINLWLKVPIVEKDGKYTGGKGNIKGTPQGGVISPLLANIYLHLLDRIVNNPKGQYAKRGIQMIRYADDFILMAHKIDEQVINRIHDILSRMELTINVTKSKMVKAKEQPFDFLGFTIRYDRSIFGKGSFWNIRPKDKSQKKIRQRLNAKLKTAGHYGPETLVDELNPIIRGWMNYYKIDGISHTQVPFRKLQDYMRDRISRYYKRKSQRGSRLYGQQAFDKLVGVGLIKPYITSGLRPVNTL